MSSEFKRDPVKDVLLTPENSALVIIDYQPVQVDSIQSMDHQTLVNNIVSVAKTAIAYHLPVILSTVNAKTALTSRRSRRCSQYSATSSPMIELPSTPGRTRNSDVRSKLQAAAS